jgi:hypothetical protein
MKVLIIDGGSYQDVTLDVDFLPRVGETVNLGAWQGTVEHVTHVPARYRGGDGEPGTELVLTGVSNTQAREPAWTAADLRHGLKRWQAEMESATNEAGQHYPSSTVSTHIGHSEQFVRWLEGNWRPTGPRIR